MQTLVSQLTTSFVDDAIELVKGFGKIIVHIATAPIERIANACDVGGVLARRPVGASPARDDESPSSSQPVEALAVAVRLPAPFDLRRRRFRSNVSPIVRKGSLCRGKSSTRSHATMSG